MDVTVKRTLPIGHRLMSYNGRCAHLHGHNYTFEVTVSGVPDHADIVVDFSILKRQLDKFLDDFDHSMVLRWDDPFEDIQRRGQRLVTLSVNPTAESFASLLFNHVQDLSYTCKLVRVQETENGWAITDRVNRNVLVKGKYNV